ncbi:hypothetical protein H0R92_05820 [Treponema sp. OMZ 840]|uniref:hypothetical protein n=1 Tax=Treponema sp. OMZ 840 TaxID=244313 RepID=UPI003D8E5792
MNAKTKIQELALNIKTAALTSPGAFVLIALLGLNQLFYAHIPCAIDLNIVFAFSIVFTASDFVKNAGKKQKIIIYSLLTLCIAAFYTLELFTYSEKLFRANSSLMILYCWIAAIVFFSPKQNYIIEFKLRFIHILVSFLFFAALYAAVFISVFFVNAIFNLDLDFVDSVIFRIANSSASVTAGIVFMSYKTKTERLHSKLFTLMFRDILSLLLPVLCVLGLIYVAKFIIFPESGDDEGLGGWYYVIFAALILCVLMMHNFDSTRLRARLISCALALAPLLFIAAALRVRQADIDTNRWFSPGFTKKDQSFVHEIIVNAVLSLFFIYTVFRDKKITIKLNAAIAAIALVLFFPVIGYDNYNAYKNLEPGFLIKTRNELEYFLYAKRASPSPRKISLYQTYTSSFSPFENVDYIIDTTGYTDILLGVTLRAELNSKPQEPTKPQKTPFEITYKDYSFRIGDDGKVLYILNAATGEQSAIDVYERAKADDDRERAEENLDEDKKTPADSVFVFENADIKMYIIRYTYYEDDYARIEFNAYIKNAI